MHQAVSFTQKGFTEFDIAEDNQERLKYNMFNKAQIIMHKGYGIPLLAKFLDWKLYQKTCWKKSTCAHLNLETGSWFISNLINTVAYKVLGGYDVVSWNFLHKSGTKMYIPPQVDGEMNNYIISTDQKSASRVHQRWYWSQRRRVKISLFGY